MAIAVNYKKCDKCGDCVKICPFQAIDIDHAIAMDYLDHAIDIDTVTDIDIDANIGLKDGYPVINAACKACGVCIKGCVRSALILIDDARVGADKNAWKGILVFGEMAGDRLHPVVRELAGKALELAGKVGHEVYAVVMSDDTRQAAAELLSYGVDKVFTYEHEVFRYFKADAFSVAFSDLINHVRPSVVLTGATSIGRSLAPRVSVRLRTGLTADCTALDITDETDLVQIRPAFGGNIMARIITPRSRPQFATVRYKVMDEAPLTAPHGEVIPMRVSGEMIKSGIEVVSVEKKPMSENISEAEILVVGGKGLKTPADLEMVKALAAKLNGQYAVTRPLVEAGWAPQTRQIGLSGRTVKPKLLLAFGVSGAVQFTAAMKDSECIFAVNNNPEAPIMDIAHYGVIGNLYEILPKLLDA